MKQLRTFLVVALAFAAGAILSHLPQAAHAAPAPVVPMTIDLSALTPADLPPPTAILPNLRSKLLLQVDQTQFSFAIGGAPKHTHANTTEVQLILGGTGTEWVGDKQLPVSPGTFVVIPPNTPHGGFTGGPFRIYAVKTPPQDPSDYHIVP
jgi:mannose-6-phosphate isomerase-like protein (cupin superfamily)